MKPLSDAIRALLGRRRAWWFRKPRLPALSSETEAHAPALPPDEEEQTLAQIGAAGEVSALPILSDFLYHGSDRVAIAAAVAIGKLASVAEPDDIARLDATLRSQHAWHVPTLRPADVVGRSFGVVGALGVFASNRDGRIREAAVRALARHNAGSELPFLLVRLNDWVPAVRDVARQAVIDRTRSDYAAHFVRWLPLVFRLPQQQRGDNAELFNDIVALLLRDVGHRALRDAVISSPHRLIRHLSLRLLTDSPADDILLTLQDALNSSDPVIRIRAAQGLRRRLDGQPLRDLLDRLATDPFMPIRREALYGHVEQLPDTAATHLRAALLDPHVSIHDVARFHLRQRGMSDFAAFYGDRLPGAVPAELPAVIAGLAEAGGRDDAPVLVPFLDHRVPRVRRAAVRAIARLDAETFRDRLLSALRDPSPSVARAARDAIGTRHYLVTATTLGSLLEIPAPPHVRRFALDLTMHLHWWDAIPLLIRAAASDDDTLRHHAAERARQWSVDPSRFLALPNPNQVRQIEDALRSHPAVFSAPVMKELRDGIVWTRPKMA